MSASRVGVGALNRVALPPERFYWAVERSLPGRMRTETMRYAFEPWLPAPLEEVETRFVRLAPHGLILCCGIDIASLQAAIEAAGGDAVTSLRPAALPEVVLRRLARDPAQEIDTEALLDDLEFRSGAFEQPAARNARRVRIAICAASLALVAAFTGAGWLRGASAARAEADRAWAAADALAADALQAAGRAGPASSGTVDQRLRLDAAVRDLERTRDRAAASLIPEDRAQTLIELLAAWPEDVPARLEHALADQTSLTLRGQARDARDAERLALALDRALPRWSEGSRSGSATRDAFAFTLILRPAPAPGPGTAPGPATAPGGGPRATSRSAAGRASTDGGAP